VQFLCGLSHGLGIIQCEKKNKISAADEIDVNSDQFQKKSGQRLMKLNLEIRNQKTDKSYYF
jgi:hypothetical protein